MSEVHLSQVIAAPREIIFGILADPDQYRKLNSSNMLVAYDRIERLPDGGFEMLWHYSALGFPVRLRTITTEIAAPARMALRTEGQIDAAMTIDLGAVEAGALVDVRVEYVVGKGILAAISEGFVANQMRYSAQTLLDSLDRAARKAASAG